MSVSRSLAAGLLVAALAAPAGAQSMTGQGGGSQGLGASTNPFLGGVTKGEVSPTPVQLSLKDAVNRALENNLGLLLQEQTAESARGAHWKALADLLPDVSAHLNAQRQIINLQAYGFPANPPLVGPFNVYDARIGASAAVIDLSAWSGARAAALDAKAAQYGIKDARDLVVLVAVNLYLEAVSDASRVDSIHAQLQTSQALLQQAQDLKTSGIVAGIDVLRAQVQVQTQTQRSIAAESQFEKTKLQLARAIGLPIGQVFVLTDKIPYAPTPELTLDDAIKRALTTRPDYLAAQSRYEAAEAARRSAAEAFLPSFHVDADYGAIGQTAAGALRTYTMLANVRIPIFDGGRTVGRRIQAEAEERQRQAELADYKTRVEYDVRAAFLDVKTAEQQLNTAKTSVDLANSELQQARDRFAAGVANNIEVTQAQEAVAAASDQYISALYAHNLAKASLARALGIAESAVTAYLGGLQ